MAFNETLFRKKIDAALEQVKTVLDNERRPTYASEVPHTYDDKFLLTDFLCNTSCAASLQALQALGISEEVLAKALDWVSHRSVSLRFTCEEKCEFVKKATRKLDPKTERTSEYKSSSGFKAKWSSKVVEKITEHFWAFEASYEIILFKGSSSAREKVVLQSKSLKHTIVTTSEDKPRSAVRSVPSIDVQITWLLQQLGKDSIWQFHIDRLDKGCATPRRNRETDAALAFFAKLAKWAADVRKYLEGELFPIHQKHALSMSSMSCDSIFVPVMPLLEDREALSKRKVKRSKGSSKAAAGEAEGKSVEGLASLPADPESGTVLSFSDAGTFLSLQQQTMDEKKKLVSDAYPAEEGLITVDVAFIVAMCGHIYRLSQAHGEAIDYIEHLIREQVVAAIGKVVTPVEFEEYMRFHYRKLFKEEYLPAQFSFAVRRPEHTPEGSLSVEASVGDGMAEPVYAISRSMAGLAEVSFPINASTRVRISAERYIHAWIGHQFSGAPGVNNLHLLARTRQFSSYILLVGSIEGPAKFNPKAGVILQNKDALSIPLDLETIPPPKAFKAAIQSLSPEMKAFAKAFRSMQLESTLFGVAVVQIKPQLERLLKLPVDSLTKEIQLTEDLLELFIKYQIPSDLLSFEGSLAASKETKIATVKGFVKAMQDMIHSRKEDELKAVKQELDYIRGCSSGSSEDDCDSDYDGLVAAKGCYETSFMQPSQSMCDDLLDFDTDTPMMDCALKEECEEYCDEELCEELCDEIMPHIEKELAPISKPEPKIEENAPKAEPIKERQEDEPKDDNSSKEKQQKPSDKSHALQDAEDLDFTQIPGELDRKFEELDEEAALRPTIIHPGNNWTLRSQKSLIAANMTSELVLEEAQRTKREAAFDLLDALSKSGGLLVDDASLHVIVAATHCFDKSLMDTIVQDNVNPIDRFERSALIVATTIHGKKAEEMITKGRLADCKAATPGLFA